MYPEGPPTGHLDTDFVGFPVFSSNVEVVPKLRVTSFSWRLPNLSSPKLNYLLRRGHQISFQIGQLTINQKIKISRPFLGPP
jgi:hypothetical protein